MIRFFVMPLMLVGFGCGIDFDGREKEKETVYNDPRFTVSIPLDDPCKPNCIPPCDDPCGSPIPPVPVEPPEPRIVITQTQSQTSTNTNNNDLNNVNQNDNRDYDITINNKNYRCVQIAGPAPKRRGCGPHNMSCGNGTFIENFNTTQPGVPVTMECYIKE